MIRTKARSSVRSKAPSISRKKSMTTKSPTSILKRQMSNKMVNRMNPKLKRGM